MIIHFGLIEFTLKYPTFYVGYTISLYNSAHPRMRFYGKLIQLYTKKLNEIKNVGTTGAGFNE